MVVGLGMANLLTGIGRLLHRRTTIRLSAIHLAWTLFVLLYLVIYWWTVVFGWRDWQDWNILVFLFVLAYGIFLFLLCVILYPTDMPDSWDAYDQFMKMRRWFFGVLLLVMLAELGDTYLKEHFDELGLPYLLLVGSWIAMALAGWFSTNRRVQTVVAVYQCVSLLAWAGYQLSDLEWPVRT